MLHYFSLVEWSSFGAWESRNTRSNKEWKQAIGAAPDALRMQRVVNFYEKLPRGAAPEVQAKGLLGRYQAKYFGKKTSVQRTMIPILPY